MWIASRYWPALWVCLALALLGCQRAAWQPRDVGGQALENGRYLDKYYRHPNFDPTAAVYQVQIFPVEQAHGLGQEQVQALFYEELLKAMTANGLELDRGESEGSRANPGQAISLSKSQKSREKPTSPVILSGVVDRLVVASPTWRFFSGRGQANLRVEGVIHQGPEVVFAFQDQVSINPPVNPKHRPPLESDLIARLAIRRFTANFLNELLLPSKIAGEVDTPAAAAPTR